MSFFSVLLLEPRPQIINGSSLTLIPNYMGSDHEQILIEKETYSYNSSCILTGRTNSVSVVIVATLFQPNNSITFIIAGLCRAVVSIVLANNGYFPLFDNTGDVME